MSTGGWSQYIDELHSQIIDLELDITLSFENYLPDLHTTSQSNVTVILFHYLFSNP